MNLLRFLLHGSDELVLPKHWLANTSRLKAYEGYTRRQLQQGAVVLTAEQSREETQRVLADREARLAQMSTKAKVLYMAERRAK